jgi:hypothetical protein
VDATIRAIVDENAGQLKKRLETRKKVNVDPIGERSGTVV